MILNFPLEHFVVFVFGFALLFISILFFVCCKTRSSLSFLFLGALLLGYFISRLDPFLILWDEQYHALVAKNMITNPFKPMLYKNPILGYDYRDWSNNYIWLHKQPLFLWQIAISMKLFGITEFAVRLPSILMHAIIPIFIYRIGKISVNEKTGFYAGLFFAAAYYPLEMAAGKFASDHNDAAFVFYVTASFWAWFEYQSTEKKYWLILIGLFAGCAVLVKWFAGLLVYGAWFFSIMREKKYRTNKSAYFSFFKSLLISLMIFVPWQLYTLNVYPAESYYELNYNTKHFTTVVEQHGSDTWFHFRALTTLYGKGDLVPYLILLGLVILFIKIKTSVYRIAVFGSIFCVYLFYTIAKTKMPAFCLIVSPFVFLGLSSLYDGFFHLAYQRIKSKTIAKILNLILLITICFFLADLSEIRHHHTDWKPKDNQSRQADMKEKEIIMKLPEILPNDKFVIFNSSITMNGHIPIMFYTNYIAYDIIPTKEQLDNVHSQGYNSAIFNSSKLPDYILQDSSITKISVN